MVTVVPVNVDEAAVVCLTLDDLLLGDLEALSVLEVAFAHSEDVFRLLGPDR